MKIREISDRSNNLIEELTFLWYGSVKGTHFFLSEEEIQAIKQYVPQALKEIPHLIIATNHMGVPIGFMGIADNKIEMLFVANDKRGKGVGKKLFTYGVDHYEVVKVDVNEQNPVAKGFYEAMGFVVYARSEEDEQGNPYPILHMKRRVNK